MENAQDVASPKKIIIPSSAVLSSSGKQYVLTPTKGSALGQQVDSTRASQQYIVTAVGSNIVQSTDETANYHTVHYIDTSGRATTTPEAVVYTNEHSPANSVHYQFRGDAYSVPGQLNYASPNTAMQFHGQGEVVHHFGQTLFIQSGTMDGEGFPISHTTRAAPATVKWLIENFESCDGVSLPRSVIYNFYMHHCQTETVEPSNPASFGKLVRMIFRDLKTRRLGQRGNSKYHYYGIRIKPTSSLNQLMPDETPVAMRQPTHPQRRVIKTEPDKAPITPKSEASSFSDTPQLTPEDKNRQYLGMPVDAIPQIKLAVDALNMPLGISQQDIMAFDSSYKKHCEEILDAVVSLQFPNIERFWERFWRKSSSGFSYTDSKLTKEKLFIISQMSEVLQYVKAMDYSFYQSLVEVLIPDVLRQIPSSLTQAIRNFAKSLEGWLKSALSNAPESVLKSKMATLTAFSHTLRRYTSLNHLAQAARAVLVNSSQIQQMMSDLARVSFSNIQEQSAWVCQCDELTITEIEMSFKQFLQEQHCLEDWKVWLENILDSVLQPYEQSSVQYSKVARNFLLKWSFYSSMVIRDLTLRSATSFGSFHLIRLLYDEYLFYLVEHKVAAATSRTPIAVMSELLENNEQQKLASCKKLSQQHHIAKPTITVVAAPNSHQSGNKTIVCIPVNSSSAPGCGDVSVPKRYKLSDN